MMERKSHKLRSCRKKSRRRIPNVQQLSTTGTLKITELNRVFSNSWYNQYINLRFPPTLRMDYPLNTSMWVKPRTLTRPHPQPRQSRKMLLEMWLTFPPQKCTQYLRDCHQSSQFPLLCVCALHKSTKRLVKTQTASPRTPAPPASLTQRGQSSKMGTLPKLPRDADAASSGITLRELLQQSKAFKIVRLNCFLPSIVNPAQLLIGCNSIIQVILDRKDVKTFFILYALSNVKDMF